MNTTDPTKPPVWPVVCWQFRKDGPVHEKSFAHQSGADGYCADLCIRFPQARVWLNGHVVQAGEL